MQKVEVCKKRLFILYTLRDGTNKNVSRPDGNLEGHVDCLVW